MRVLVRESFRYANGAVAALQKIDVFDRSLSSRPDVFTADGATAPAPNPLMTDAQGNLSFYVEEGSYDFGAFGARVPFDAEAPSGGASRFVHTQTTPASSWTLHHGLGTAQAPTVVLDSEPNAVSWTDMEVIDQNTMALSFDSAVTGKAYL